VLYARLGRQHCRVAAADQCSDREQIIARRFELPEATKVLVMAPVIRGQKGEHRDLFANDPPGLRSCRVDGQIEALAQARRWPQRAP